MAIPAPALDHIPAPLLAAARDAGLDAQAITSRWAKYVDWHVRTHGDDDYRMGDWRRHVQWELDDERHAIPKPLSDHEREALGLLREREREKALADELYDREKVTFADWIASLEARERGYGAPLAPHEQRLLDWRRGAARTGTPTWGLSGLWAFGLDAGEAARHG